MYNSESYDISVLMERFIMRVIAGKARRTNLVTPEGRHTRPTSDRIKETLFNMLQQELYDTHFLDIFSGSGGIAIEALSRGAKEAVMIDNDNEAVRCIKENIRRTHFEDVTRVLKMDAVTALKKLDMTGNAFDIIFMDPPYNHDIEKKILEFLSDSCLVHKGTLIIVETSLETDISYMYDMSYSVEKVKEYKTNRHVFIRI